MSERFDTDIFAYVLMDNHYHLLLRTPNANLSKSMQWFGTAYTRRSNLDHYQSGHLFQGRFKSILVQNDAYLMQLSYKLNRDILLYVLWQEGKYADEKIGNILGLTHSAVSRRVSITRKKIEREKGFN